MSNLKTISSIDSFRNAQVNLLASEVSQTIRDGGLGTRMVFQNEFEPSCGSGAYILSRWMGRRPPACWR